MPGPFVHVSPEASTWKGRPRIPVLDRIHRSGFPDGADDGIRTRGLLLGKQACCRCTTSAWPGFPNGFGPYPLRSAIGVLSRTREPRPRCEGWDSNPRPPGYEPGGLPNCPTPHGRAFPGTPHGKGRVPDGPQGAVPGRRRGGARVCGPTVAAKHAMEESNLRGRFWRPSDCHCPNGVLCFPLFDCQTSPPASGVRPRAAACDGMRPRRGGHPLRRVASHGRARRRPARRPGACLSAGSTPRTAMRPPTPPIRPALRAPATGRRRPCPEARTPRTATPPRTPSSLRKP